MKNLLIIGNSPLPSENTKSRPAAGLRTNQFLVPLLEGFKVTLVTVAMPECYDENEDEKEISHNENFQHIRISKNNPNLAKRLQEIHDQIHPDAIISVNTHPSFLATQIESPAPLWADLNGWCMAEAQAQAHKLDSNDYLPHYFEMERAILRRADKISCVSEAQKYAVLGELASLGRLNNESFGYKFTYAVANGTEFFDGEDLKEKKEREKANDRIEEIFDKVPKEAFIALWLGGYNTWVDEKTLFESLEETMKKCPDFYFVSTGGKIAGLDNKTFAHFQKMIDGSKYKDRFVFLGWVATADIPSIYERANIGLNVDRKCTETYTGARNRINEMMKFGLPVVTTLGSEISFEVDRVKAGMGVKSGRHEELTEAFVVAYHNFKDRHGYKLKEMGENGAKYIADFCNYDELAKPLLNWLENPRPAPDRSVNVKLSGFNIFKSGFRYLRENGLLKSWKKFWQKVKSKL
jgi:glycosyltransferase involved in cell wall biosynthesis